MKVTRGMQLEKDRVSKRRRTLGNALIYFCIFGLLFSSTVKFLQPPNAVAYMASLGYEHGMYFLIAALELFCGIVFLRKSTRAVGLLLVSAYFGGAISAHWASHPPVAGGPFLTYMLNHPFLGSLEPGMFLAAAWMGTWLLHPERLRSWDPGAAGNEASPQVQPGAAVLSGS